MMIEKICCGSAHTLVLTSNGTLYGWGYNHRGQLGIVKEGITIDKPTRLIIISLLNDNLFFKYIYCRNHSSFAITTNGVLLSWGYNDYGVLGQGVNNEN